MLADQIVILQIDGDIFPGTVLSYFPQGEMRAPHPQIGQTASSAA
jgi:hypothetical protein